MTTPYAKLLVTVNGGAPESGGLAVAVGNTIHLSGESTVGWVQQLFEIYDFPVGFALPSGWTDSGHGTYFYASDPFPPSFVVSPWGKFMLRLTVNRGLNGSGNADSTLVDASTALSAPSPHGLLDLGFLEAGQFNAEREWTGDEKANLRTIEASLGGGVTFGGDLATVDATHQKVVGLQGMPISSVAATPGQVLTDVGGTATWASPGGGSLPAYFDFCAWYDANSTAVESGGSASYTCGYAFFMLAAMTCTKLTFYTNGSGKVWKVTIWDHTGTVVASGTGTSTGHKVTITVSSFTLSQFAWYTIGAHCTDNLTYWASVSPGLGPSANLAPWPNCNPANFTPGWTVGIVSYLASYYANGDAVPTIQETQHWPLGFEP